MSDWMRHQACLMAGALLKARHFEKEEREAAEARRLAEMDEKERKKREAAMGPAAKKGGKKSTKA